jgi:integrase
MKEFPGLYRRGRLYWFAKQTEGNRVFIPLKTDDLSEAIRRAREHLDSPILAQTGTLADLIEPFLHHKAQMDRYSASSVKVKRTILNKFAKFANLPADKVGKPTMQSFYDAQLAGGLTADTAGSYLGVVRAFFRWCVTVRKLRRDNPCTELHLKRVTPKARRNFCPPELVEKLINDCPNDDLKFVLFCGFHAGMRKGEIIEAKEFWFDIVNRQIHMRKHEGIQFKDHEERSLPMTSQFAEFLIRYGLRKPYMLKPDVERGRSLYRYDFKRPFAEYVAAKGCDWVTPHVMRHTFASLLASAGEDIFNIAVWMGDDVRVVQKHYAKLLPVKRDLGRAFQASSVTVAPPV